LQPLFFRITSNRLESFLIPKVNNLDKPVRIRYIWLLAVLTLAACRPAVLTETPIPTQEIWQIHYTPDLNWLGPMMNLCIFQQPGIGLVVNELPAPALDTSQAMVTFRWGSPEKLSGFPVIVGFDDLNVIVHPENPLQSLSKADLQDIFSGHIHTWSSLKKVKNGLNADINVWVLPPGDEAQDLFEYALLQGSLANRSASIAPDPEAMRGTIAADRAAIGILPARWLDKSVHAVKISDVKTETLHQPILAIVPIEPPARQKDWLLCLQRSINP
jgi:hypothetical protein